MRAGVPVLEVLAGCDLCPPTVSTEGRLFAVVDGRRLCAAHWIAAGCPWPRALASPLEVHEAEVRIRERMQARGGADRHLVRSGKS
jgi:hypothetical protein